MIKLKLVLKPVEETGVVYTAEDILKDFFEDLNKYVADDEPVLHDHDHSDEQ